MVNAQVRADSRHIFLLLAVFHGELVQSGLRVPLGQGLAGARFHERDVGGVDRAVRSHVLAEIGGRDRDAGLRFGLGHVGGADGLARVGVAGEDVHAHRGVGQNLRVAVRYAAQGDGDLLHVGHAGEIYRHGVAGEGGLPETLPAPAVTLAFPLTTSLLKVTTRLWAPPLERHSTPGAPLSGKGMSKSPALP